MTHKYRQIQKFTELIDHLLSEARLDNPPPNSPDNPPSNSTNVGASLDDARDATKSRPKSPSAPPPTPASQNPSGAAAPSDLHSPISHFPSPPPPLRLYDMGSGKGYLTFALAARHPAIQVTGIETRPDLVETCNAAAAKNHLKNLRFLTGNIADTPLDTLDILVALHACDTATDDALAKGIRADARLIVVSPCCHKELRPQLTPPPLLAAPLRHGIFLERHAEFLTDALRVLLLEWSGYRTKAFEFISTEHTSKNLMIAAIKTHGRQAADSPLARQIRDLLGTYQIKTQRLLTHLDFPR